MAICTTNVNQVVCLVKLLLSVAGGCGGMLICCRRLKSQDRIVRSVDLLTCSPPVNGNCLPTTFPLSDQAGATVQAPIQMSEEGRKEGAKRL